VGSTPPAGAKQNGHGAEKAGKGPKGPKGAKGGG
jgi:hypothetical protein